jgi:hypothetical protein
VVEAPWIAVGGAVDENETDSGRYVMMIDLDSGGRSAVHEHLGWWFQS